MKRKISSTRRKPLTRRNRGYNLPEPFVVDVSIPTTSDRVDYVPEKKSLVDEILTDKKHVRAEVERKMASSV